MISLPNTTEITYNDTLLDVPYASQYLDVMSNEHKFRACGMTSVYMVLKYFGAADQSLDELITRGEREGGYGPSGWIHDYLVKMFRDHGFACERRENVREREVTNFRDAIKAGNPVIVSVERVLFDRRDFHIIVLTGVRENTMRELQGFFYHDPGDTREMKHRYVPISTFYLSWRRMAILPKKV